MKGLNLTTLTKLMSVAVAKALPFKLKLVLRYK